MSAVTSFGAMLAPPRINTFDVKSIFADDLMNKNPLAFWLGVGGFVFVFITSVLSLCE